jgi:hypothetical protein
LPKNAQSIGSAINTYASVRTNHFVFLSGFYHDHHHFNAGLRPNIEEVKPKKKILSITFFAMLKINL